MIDSAVLLDIVTSVSFGGIMVGAAFAQYHRYSLRKARARMNSLIAHVDVGIAAAERILANPETPQALRMPIILMLRSLTSKEVMYWLNDLLNRKEATSPTSEISTSIAQLRLSNPHLAADLELAIFGVAMVGAPLRYSIMGKEVKLDVPLTTPDIAINKVAYQGHLLAA